MNPPSAPSALSTPTSTPASASASAGMLLLVVGALLGAMFPLGKAALAAGVPPAAWAALLAGTSGAIVGALAWLRRPRAPQPAPAGGPPAAGRPSGAADGAGVSAGVGHRWRYYAVGGLLSSVVPNLLLLTLIPRLGSGPTAVYYALSPVLTTGVAALVGLARPSRLELAGIVVGLAGVLLVISGRGELGRPAEPLWLALGLLVPLSLAIGNVYRTLDWPRGVDAMTLGAGSNLFSATVLLAWTLAAGEAPRALAAIATIPMVAALQVVAGSAMTALFFRLQRVGGPVTISQIGTVASGVGIGLGAFVLGERYAPVVWIGCAVIAAGIGATVIAKRRLPPVRPMVPSQL